MMFSFIIDGNGGTYITQLAFQMSCYFVGIILLYTVTILYVTNTNYFLEDSVIIPAHIEKNPEGHCREDEEKEEGQEEHREVVSS